VYLTRQEEEMLDGEHGWAYQVSMEVLVKLGDLFGASRLIPIKSAHISGVSYKTMGDAPIDFLDALVKEGGKAKKYATANPSGFDPEYLVGKLPERYAAQQLRILNLYGKMNVKPTFTCTPYYLREPRPGWHLAWSESSASMYANSVIGAWSNREGGPSALAAALIGKTPNYGVHQTENRQPNVIVEVERALQREMEFGALGIHLGKTLKDSVPAIENLIDPLDEDLKQLGAGMASSGMSSMFYYRKPAIKEKIETLSVEARDIDETIGSLSTATEKPDLIFMGCPHCSAAEVEKIARLIEGKKVAKGIELWVCTSRYVKRKAKKHVDTIERAGGHVLCDTCAIVTWTKKLGIDVIMTNSAKAAYYAPTLNDADAILAPMSRCVDVACGRKL